MHKDLNYKSCECSTSKSLKFKKIYKSNKVSEGKLSHQSSCECDDAGISFFVDQESIAPA